MDTLIRKHILLLHTVLCMNEYWNGMYNFSQRIFKTKVPIPVIPIALEESRMDHTASTPSAVKQISLRYSDIMGWFQFVVNFVDVV